MTRIAFAQFRPILQDAAANLAAVARLAAQGAAAGLLVFPELCTTGYELRDRAMALSLAEPFGSGPASVLAARLAREFDTTLVIGYAERDGDRAYNSCLLATPEGGLFNYRKLHLFSREKDLFDPGDAPPPVISTPAGRVGLMICFDWFFPETARLLALAGAQVIAHPSNLVLPYCQRAMFARCIENHVFAVTCNRFGTEDAAGRSLTFTGASQIVGPRGDVLASAPVDCECVAMAEIDPAEADNKRINPYNDLFEDRRVELYRPLASQE